MKKAKTRTAEQAKQRKADYEAALKHLTEAKKLFEKIGREDQLDFDANHFAYQTAMIISCDDGECGVEAFIRDHL